MIIVARIFFYLFIGFLPFQIDSLVVSSEVYFSGFFNPYLSHFVYVSDVFLLFSLLFFAFSLLFKEFSIEWKFDLKNRLNFALLIFVLTYFVSIFFSTDKLNSLFYGLRMLEFLIVYFLVLNKFVDKKKILIVFSTVMGLVAFVGILQYFFQESLGLRFFGEPIISSKELGVAKVDLSSDKVLRSYGTFPHPNIFAAYLLMAIFSLIYLWKAMRSKRHLFGILILVCFLALILTFSRVALFGFIVSCIYLVSSLKLKIKMKYVVSFVLGILFLLFSSGISKVFYERFLFNDEAIHERVVYLQTSKKMFLENPFGVGAGNFTMEMQNYDSEKLSPWEFQPVHNVFLLILNEIGVFGFTAFVFLVGSIFFAEKKRIFSALGIAFIVIALTDHFFISLYQGQALFFLYLGLLSEG